MVVFAIGELIKPKSKTPYNVTDGEGTVLKVLKNNGKEEDSRGDIKDLYVRVEERLSQRLVGTEHWVCSKYFLLIDSEDDAFLDSL